MSSILIADASHPFSLAVAGALAARGDAVVLTDGPRVARGVSGGPSTADIPTVPWNRESPLSARTVAIEAATAIGPIDAAVVFLDARAIPETDSFSLSEASARIDEWARGPILLSLEMANRFRARGAGRLVLALRDRETPDVDPVSAAALGSFARFAEALATSLSAADGARGGPSALLVKLDGTDDADAALWLAERLAAPGRWGGNRWVRACSKGLLGML